MTRHIMLMAGEASGDMLGAHLMGELKGFRFSGIGGEQMLSEGLAPLFPLERIAQAGFVDVARRLPSLLWHVRAAARAVIAARPDMLVIIDSYDFNHRVARFVFRHAPEIPIVNYAPPKAWGWRRGRAKKMRRYIRRLLVLFPFEVEAFAKLDGPEAVYVGHPACAHVASKQAVVRFRAAYEGKKLILIGLGSRVMEINLLAPIFGKAAALIAEALADAVFIMPVASERRGLVEEKIAAWPVRPVLIEDEAEKRASFGAADIALAASGTLTFELSLADTPFVCAYRLRWIEESIARWITDHRIISLANLILGRKAFPEFKGRAEVKAPALAQAVLDLLAQDKSGDLELLKAKMKTAHPPSKMAARAVLELIDR